MGNYEVAADAYLLLPLPLYRAVKRKIETSRWLAYKTPNQKREASDVTARIFDLKRDEEAFYGCCCALTFTVTLFESKETFVFGLSLSCNFAVTLSVCDEASQNVASKVQL
jgi:hypothetical protein